MGYDYIIIYNAFASGTLSSWFLGLVVMSLLFFEHSLSSWHNKLLQDHFGFLTPVLNFSKKL